ncbi:Cx9C motif-containing protein 4, mitochondrial [Tolypocladium ophioglossoides CBS 100239]|uniref:Cx9C motif-containing protein 4, mitochondrial n=1 Tax=Tolypocladium ophioglossoides (strain CBS 100239) TaxID=1163406 RepID=A0A0L0N970_TOLOC|nr:Cx9C motif-containing protein 4, mitochondrial [Tolypocladium ophioglossoides CBS 100239]
MPQSSLRSDVGAKPPCHPRALPLRLDWHTADLERLDCLTRNNYNEAKCQDVVKALYECCEAFYQRYGDEATSPSCPKPNLLRLKIKQQDEGK